MEKEEHFSAPQQMHAGHRQRLRDRFITEGLDNFEPHLILEMILFYALPQKDTNPIAHRLLDRFGGSLSRVLDAPIEELTQVEGIGKNAAVLLKLFPEVCRQYLIEQSRKGDVVKSSTDAAKYLLPIFMSRLDEQVALMCLDGKGKIVFCDIIFKGSVNAAAVSVRRIVEIVLRYACADVILAHNHPTGNAVPSQQDILVTQKVSDALEAMGINLLDHLIVSGNDWVSLAATPTLAGMFHNRAGFRIY